MSSVNINLNVNVNLNINHNNYNSQKNAEVCEKIEKENLFVISELNEKNPTPFLLYEDENLIAIDKPSGLATQGGTGVEFCIDDALKVKKYQLVHRLDKDTSGILLIAKNNLTADQLTLAFKNKNIDKTYLALVYNLVKKDHGTINIPLIKKNLGKNDKVLPDHIDGKIAITNYEVLHRFTNFTLLKLMPITGRTHQIRVHCKEIGYPILNDVKYGGTKVLRKELSPRLCLHAHKITINGYLSQPLTITSDLPDFLQKFKKFIQ
jgi:23S rRNA pseudouridine955/2504/2580 synthase